MPLRSITLPPPISFPRTGYADVLADHARLLARHASALHAAIRARLRTDEDLDLVDHYAARIVAQGRPDDVVDVMHIETSVRYWRAYRGIAGRLLQHPPDYHLYVVVVAGCAVSLHTMHLDAHRLAPAGVALVVEPCVQRHRVSGFSPLLVTRWLDPDGEARFAWVPIPPEPASPAETLERLAALREAEIRSAISVHAAAGRHDPFVLLRSDSLGDRVTVEHRKLAVVVTQPYPKVLEALGRSDPHGRVPVVTDASGHASLRWFDPHAQTPLTSVAAELVEAHVWPAELADLVADAAGEKEPEEDDLSWVTFPEPAGKRSPEEILSLIEMETGFDEIDEYLGEMTPDQLDRAIAEAGFDPAMETKRGIGLREKVVMAIAEKR